MKYDVLLPKMSKAQLVVEYGDKKDVYELDSKQRTFIFEIDEKFSWIHSGKIVDRNSFEVYAVDQSGKKKYLVPQKV